MKTKTTLIISLLIIALVFVSGWLVYSQMPGPMITHWNAQGQPDGYSSKTTAMVLMPLMMLFTSALLFGVPLIDPLRKNIESFRGIYNQTILVVNGFLLVVHVVSLAWNMGWRININVVMLVAVGLMLFLLGRLMSHARRNYFFGIRTPWTLSSDLVWEKTHRFGGKVFQVAGGALLLGALIPDAAFAVIMLVVLGSALVPVVYSYVVWRQIEQQVGQ